VHPFTTASHAKFLVADDGNGAALAEVLRSLYCVAGRQASCFGVVLTGLGSRSRASNLSCGGLGTSANWPGPTTSLGNHWSDGPLDSGDGYSRS
jgi:hypothetical protein